MFIKKIGAKRIHNSRKENTIQIILKTDNGKFEASAPSGASTGKYEVMAFPKEGVNSSIRFVKEVLTKELKDFEINKFEDLELIEDMLKKYDSSSNWSKIGGNLVVALEFAILKALSKNNLWIFLNKDTKQVPRPLGKCVGGGKHTRKKPSTDFQEFLLLSLDAKNFSNAIRANNQIYNLLERELRIKDKTFRGEIDDEGGYSPNLSNEEVLEILSNVVKKVSTEYDFQVRIGLDIAASSFYDGMYYKYWNFSEEKKVKKLSREEQIKYVIDLINKYNLVYVEDPLHEEDFKGFAEIRKKTSCLICGDDLTVTDPKRLKRAIKSKSINTVIAKPNQIGSLIKMKEFIDIAKKNKIHPVISHRSGETKDTSISHLAVGFNCPIIKIGIYGKERLVKINEIKKIEQQIKYKK